MTSILDSIKDMLGVNLDETAFDTIIIANINTAFMTLNQLGVGPSSVFLITNKDQQWNDFFGELTGLEGVKNYVYLRVKVVFDPPDKQTVMDALKRNIEELEFRLMIQMAGV